jgi:hypothetical protein
MKTEIQVLVDSLVIKEIQTEPCFICYTCREVDSKNCHSYMNGYRLQWFETSPEDDEGFESYPENDFFLDFSSRDGLAEVLNLLPECDARLIQYVLQNKNAFNFELIKFKRG